MRGDLSTQCPLSTQSGHSGESQLERFLFGSDYPFVPIPQTTVGLTKLGIAAADLQAIERGNAQALLPRWKGKL